MAVMFLCINVLITNPDCKFGITTLDPALAYCAMKLENPCIDRSAVRWYVHFDTKPLNSAVQYGAGWVVKPKAIQITVIIEKKNPAKKAIISLWHEECLWTEWYLNINRYVGRFAADIKGLLSKYFLYQTSTYIWLRCAVCSGQLGRRCFKCFQISKTTAIALGVCPWDSLIKSVNIKCCQHTLSFC